MANDVLLYAVEPMTRTWKIALLAFALTAPLTLTTTLRADDKKYHDQKNNDDHQWNAKEDKAYRSWTKENHRKYQSFDKIKEDDRQSYWAWRHEHPDSK